PVRQAGLRRLCSSFESAAAALHRRHLAVSVLKRPRTIVVTIMRTVAMVAVFLIAAAGSATTTDQGNRFVQTILVANKASFHPQMVNPDMINPWGIAVRPPGAGGHFWINNAG